MKNFTILYTDYSSSTMPMPTAWTTSAKDKEGALRAFRLNKGHGPSATVQTVVQLPVRAPKKYNTQLF
jgi:hypothetical protein